jgi:hypothetical protein
MANADILAATGGLPPSAFLLLPEHYISPAFTSVHDKSSFFGEPDSPQFISNHDVGLVDTWTDNSISNKNPPAANILIPASPHSLNSSNSHLQNDIRVAHLSFRTDASTQTHSSIQSQQTNTQPEISIKTLPNKAIPAEKRAGRRRFTMPKFSKASLENSFQLEPYPEV